MNIQIKDSTLDDFSEAAKDILSQELPKVSDLVIDEARRIERLKYSDSTKLEMSRQVVELAFKNTFVRKTDAKFKKAAKLSNSVLFLMVGLCFELPCSNLIQWFIAIALFVPGVACIWYSLKD